MSFCLIKPLADKFRKALKDGTINPDKLEKMSPKARHDFLADLLGEENATPVNALFESKMLLKNKQQGYIAWAEHYLGGEKNIQRDIISKIQKMDRVLSVEEEKAFMNDLADMKLGTHVSFEEAQKITQLSKQISENQKLDLSLDENRIKLGNSMLDMQDYVEGLNPTKAPIIQNILNAPRSLMASMDLSAAGRQGWGLLTTKNYWKAFGEMFKYAISEKAYRNLMADIITRPNYKKATSAGLRITKLSDKLNQREEQFMSNILDKVPGMRGSERAYTGFLNKLRMDTFDSMMKNAEMSGLDISKGSKNVKDMADVINTFTGSGSAGKFDPAVATLNGLFFSPRKITATVNMLNPLYYAKLSPQARIFALKNLVGSVGVVASILGLVKMNGGDVETDPRSSDFGKAKLGDTRFDITGGNATYATFLARLLSGKSKSTATDIVSPLQPGYGATTRGDLMVKFFRNKLSPVASMVADWLYGTDAVGKPFNLKDEVINRSYPLIINSVVEAYKNDPNLTLVTALAELFGIGTQTYNNDKDWSTDTTKAITKFKKSVSEDKFKQANKEFNEEVKRETKELQDSKEYKNLDDESKQKRLTELKAKIKKEVLNKYK